MKKENKKEKDVITKRRFDLKLFLTSQPMTLLEAGRAWLVSDKAFEKAQKIIDKLNK